MRSSLILLGCACAFTLGTWCALVACENHARARELDQLQRRWEELRGLHARLSLSAESHVPGEPRILMSPGALPRFSEEELPETESALLEMSQ